MRFMVKTQPCQVGLEGSRSQNLNPGRPAAHPCHLEESAAIAKALESFGSAARSRTSEVASRDDSNVAWEFLKSHGQLACRNIDGSVNVIRGLHPSSTSTSCSPRFNLSRNSRRSMNFASLTFMFSPRAG